jgi:hypothetical protein
MHGRPAPARVVAVHPVVVDEEVDLEELDRDHRRQRLFPRRRGSTRDVARAEERGAHPLAAAQREPLESAGRGTDLGAHGGGGSDAGFQERREPLVDLRASRGEQRFERRAVVSGRAFGHAARIHGRERHFLPRLPPRAVGFLVRSAPLHAGAARIF